MSRTFLRSELRAVAALCALVASGSAAAQTIVTFSAQDGDDTYAAAINAAGVVTGPVCGDDFCYGYVRAADGKIRLFYGPNTLETIPTAINRNGLIAGSYFDDTPAFAGHGFLRKPGGKFITVDVPGATDTEIHDVNDRGTITGEYDGHGFVRAADGTITTFDPAGSTGTVATAINANGDVAGYYWYTANNAHGFLRTADGTIASFDVKNANYTQVYGINRKDAIVGSGAGAICFERTRAGKIKTFEPGHGPPNPTEASDVDDNGEIIGFYATDEAPYLSAFVGSPKSGFTSFNVDGGQTQPLSINDNGVIAGSYSDPNSGQLNGFVRIP